MATAEQQRIYRQTHKQLIKERAYEYLKQNPWFKHFKNIRQRCNNPRKSNYKYYGGKGIKCLLTLLEIKELWFRDRAYEMKQPSIDRERSNGHYEFSNCRFMEQSQNSKRTQKRRNSSGRFSPRPTK